jgi:hypothetical protein
VYKSVTSKVINTVVERKWPWSRYFSNWRTKSISLINVDVWAIRLYNGRKIWSRKCETPVAAARIDATIGLKGVFI